MLQSSSNSGSSQTTIRRSSCWTLFARRRLVPAVLAGVALFASAPARAAQPSLTRQRLAELVKAAPAAHVARSEARASAASLRAAGVAALENPIVSGMGGLRFNPDGSRPFNGVATLSWPVELGGQRGGRIEAARAEQRFFTTAALSEEQRLLFEALLQHALVLRGERQLEIAGARYALSRRFHAAAERRYAAGSVPQLDVTLASLQEQRDAALLATARGSRDADKYQLLALLGLERDLPVTGALVPEGEVPALASLVGLVDRQPEVRAASAAVAAAGARAARERAARWPALSVLAQYERDDHADIGMLGLSVPIPILNANRIEVAGSSGAAQVARARLLVSRAAAVGRLKQLHARYRATAAALDALTPAAALATRAVNLATRGYELGENDLASVLLVWREAIEAEAGLLEAQHAHAAVKIELLVAAGRTPE